MAVAGDLTTQGISFERVEDITPYKVRTDLNPMIRNAERFDLQAARDRVCDFLNECMVLTEKESAFLKQFAAGCYEPRLLLVGVEVLPLCRKLAVLAQKRHEVAGKIPAAGGAIGSND